MMAVQISNRSRQFKHLAVSIFVGLFLCASPALGQTDKGVESPDPVKTGRGNYGYFRMEQPKPETPPKKEATTAPASQPEQPSAAQTTTPTLGMKSAVPTARSVPTIPEQHAAAKTMPWRSDAGLQIAESQMVAGQYAQALQTLNKALARHQGNPDVHAYIGQCYFHLGMMQEARKSLERALMGDPEHMGAHLFIGLLHLKEGHRDLVVERLAALRSLCKGLLCEEENYLSDQLNTTKPVQRTAKEEERHSRWMFWKKD